MKDETVTRTHDGILETVKRVGLSVRRWIFGSKDDDPEATEHLAWRQVGAWKIENARGINEGDRLGLIILHDDKRAFTASDCYRGADQIRIPRRGKIEDALEIAARHVKTRGKVDVEELTEEINTGVCRVADVDWLNTWMTETGLEPSEIIRRLRRQNDDLDAAIQNEIEWLRDWQTSPDSEVPHRIPESILPGGRPNVPITLDLEELEARLHELADEM
jgi:hypothetical protein